MAYLLLSRIFTTQNLANDPHEVRGILREFCVARATAISRTCQFSMLLAAARRTFIGLSSSQWIRAPMEVFVGRLPGGCADDDNVGPCAPVDEPSSSTTPSLSCAALSLWMATN